VVLDGFVRKPQQGAGLARAEERRVTSVLEFALVGAGGEPVDLWRTVISHGFAELPPMHVEEGDRALEVTLPTGRGRPRTVRITNGGDRVGVAEVRGPAPSAAADARIVSAVRHVLRMDEDLSPFYELATRDPALAWVGKGAGRMLQSPSVFEDVVKTICTTNCAWSATERMVGAIVEHLGIAAPGAPLSGPRGRSFPSPDAMADAGEAFYREVARAGYRGAYLISLARTVAEGRLDLEELGRAPHEELPDEEVEARLLSLPGVGPYAAAHIMMTIGRYSRLILDSWTRPTYARVSGRRTPPSDASIVRRFRRYGRYAGLAFWCVCTRDWSDDR
jgi:3-methyladenine DNA glycosylase/8-oxoguanine DNA glycosylase